MSSELKVFTLPLKTNIFGRVIVSQSYYGKSAVDAVISEKDRALEFAKALTLKDIKTIEEKDKEIAELKRQRDGAFCLANSGLTLEDISQMARKEIDRQKYKRCLLRSVIAEMNATHFKDLFYGAGSGALADAYNEQITIHYKWNKLWLKLAEKFKEASDD